jgi:hypothetical protein
MAVELLFLSGSRTCYTINMGITYEKLVELINKI